jgi:hypothetical protein
MPVYYVGDTALDGNPLELFSARNFLDYLMSVKGMR